MYSPSYAVRGLAAAKVLVPALGLARAPALAPTLTLLLALAHPATVRRR